MFNYKSHVLEMNQKLAEQGDEPLYIVYPAEGLGMADFPFSFISKGNARQGGARSAKLQDYLLSEPACSRDRGQGAAGRRAVRPGGPGDLPARNGAPMRRAPSTRSSTRPRPSSAEALARYQTDFRKPSFTVYCLDYSGSMRGRRAASSSRRRCGPCWTSSRRQVPAAGRAGDVTIVLTFDHTIINDAEIDSWTVQGNDRRPAGELLARIESQQARGSTDIYQPVARALELMKEQGIGDRFPAIILMTDGQSNTGHRHR